MSLGSNQRKTKPGRESPGTLAKIGSWISRVTTQLCDHPDHLQRLAIIGAGIVMYPLLIALILIVWRGFDSPTLMSQQLEILGHLALGSLGIFGLVIVALLGIIRGVRAKLPGGASLEVTLDEPLEPDTQAPDAEEPRPDEPPPPPPLNSTRNDR